MKLEIGKEYKCLDINGISFCQMTYLGKGRKYDIYDRKKGCAAYPQEELYVFEIKGDNRYKFAACRPIYKNLEFTETFEAIAYGQDLNHIFVEFRQTYFQLEGPDIVELEDFPKPYSSEVQNSSNIFFL